MLPLLKKAQVENNMHHEEKLDGLREIFGLDGFMLEEGRLVIRQRNYQVTDDVTVLLESEQYPIALHFHVLLVSATMIRRVQACFYTVDVHTVITVFSMWSAYILFVGGAYFLAPFRMGQSIPLYEFNQGKNLSCIRQGVFKCFFPRIEYYFCWC